MWYQIKISGCPAAAVEQFSDELQFWGAVAVTLLDEHDNPVLEPGPGETPLWPDIIITALFNEAAARLIALDQIQSLYPDYQCQLSEFADQDWQRAWMDDFKPMQFGSKLWVCPSWSTPPDDNAVNIMLDPGLAFGSGTHETTALCLQFLEQTELKGKTVIDYGCGSGILAIAALKLGAKQVYAIDIDEQALEATKANAINNDIDLNQLSINLPGHNPLKADIIVANILAQPLIELKQHFHELISNSGIIAISGLLLEQRDKVLEHYSVQFQIISQQQLGDWSLLVFKKHS